MLGKFDAQIGVRHWLTAVNSKMVNHMIDKLFLAVSSGGVRQMPRLWESLSDWAMMHHMMIMTVECALIGCFVSELHLCEVFDHHIWFSNNNNNNNDIFLDSAFP